MDLFSSIRHDGFDRTVQLEEFGLVLERICDCIYTNVSSLVPNGFNVLKFLECSHRATWFRFHRGHYYGIRFLSLRSSSPIQLTCYGTETVLHLSVTGHDPRMCLLSGKKLTLSSRNDVSHAIAIVIKLTCKSRPRLRLNMICSKADLRLSLSKFKRIV